MAPHRKTLVRLFEKSAADYVSNPMFWEKTKDTYMASSYGQMRDRICELAGGLVSLGVGKGDRVALLSQARKDWVTAELGVLYAGAINVPLSVKLESADLLFRLRHSGAKVLITSAFQYPKLKTFLAEMKDLEKVILLDPQDEYDAREVFLEDLLQKGRMFIRDNQEKFQELVGAVEEDDCALISYTSGTTADPKGIMLSHKNLVTNCEQSLSLFSVEEDYRILLILPLDHSFAHTTGMYVFLASGASLASVQAGRTPAASLKNLFANIREIRPDALLSVPTVAKNMRKNIESGVRKKGGLTFFFFRTGLKAAYRYYGMSWNKGKGLRWLYWPYYKLIDTLVFKAVRQNFGGKLRYFVGGGALLDVELQKFFLAIGLPMYQGYGLSEASPVISSNTIQHHKLGSSGKVVPNLEVNICDEDGNVLPAGQKGEIVVKGDNVMLGYFRNEAATKEAIRGGWLYTGDMGYFDRDGYLFVLGRFKSLLIGDDGEKYSPEGIEEYIEEHSVLIEQILIYNNQDPYTTALVYPDVSALANELARKGVGADSKDYAREAVRLIRDELESCKNGQDESDFPDRWLPVTFALLEEGFTEENHFLNSTLKMVRGKIIESYSQRIRYMYTPEGKDSMNPKNIDSAHSVLKMA